MGQCRLRWLGIALAAGAFAFAGCGDDEEEPAPAAGGGVDSGGDRGGREVPGGFDAGGKIQEKGEITIGVKFDVPPFGVKNPQTGDVEGFDVEMGKAVAAKLGVKPKFIEAISDNRIPFLEDGTADLILSTMTINEERVGADRLLRPVLHRARARARAGRLGHHGRRRPGRQERLHGARLDLRGEPQEAGARGQAQARRLLLGVPRADPERRGRRGLHGRRDPHGHDHPGRHAQARRRPADAGALRRRHQEGRRRDGRRSSTSVFQGLKDNGTWAKLHEEWIGKYTEETGEPPTIGVAEAVELVKNN